MEFQNQKEKKQDRVMELHNRKGKTIDRAVESKRENKQNMEIHNN